VDLVNGIVTLKVGETKNKEARMTPVPLLISGDPGILPVEKLEISICMISPVMYFEVRRSIQLSYGRAGP
jgi:hypothetical protein